MQPERPIYSAPVYPHVFLRQASAYLSMRIPVRHFRLIQTLNLILYCTHLSSYSVHGGCLFCFSKTLLLTYLCSDKAGNISLNAFTAFVCTYETLECFSRVSRQVRKPLGVVSDGWLPVQNKVCLRLESNLDYHVFLSSAGKRVIYCAIRKTHGTLTHHR